MTADGKGKVMSFTIDSCQSFRDAQETGCTIKDILNLIEREREASTSFPFIVAIDGRCASGKTTVSKALSEALKATVVHMDDFFLRPHQADRMLLPLRSLSH